MTLRTAMTGLAAMGLLALMGAAGYGLAFPVGGEAKTVTGIVERMTEAPKGEIDGAVLDDGTAVHWPPHLAEEFTAIVKAGERIEASGRTERRPGGDEVLEVRVVTNLRTKEARRNDDPPPPPKKDKKEKAKRKGKEKTVAGKVKRLTEAPKGEIDGAVLSDGTTIHWPPHLEKRFTAVLKVGDSVEATGWEEETPEGAKVLEVRSVTNLKTDETAKNDGPPPPKEKGKKGKGKKDDE